MLDLNRWLYSNQQCTRNLEQPSLQFTDWRAINQATALSNSEYYALHNAEFENNQMGFIIPYYIILQEHVFPFPLTNSSSDSPCSLQFQLVDVMLVSHNGMKCSIQQMHFKNRCQYILDVEICFQMHKYTNLACRFEEHKFQSIVTTSIHH